MSEICYIGVDPGVTGAFAVYYPKTGDVIAKAFPDSLAELIRYLKNKNKICALAALELVHSRPGQSAQSTFTFGRNFGNWEAALEAADIPYIVVDPRKWKNTVLDSARGRKFAVPKGADLKTRSKILNKNYNAEKKATVKFVNRRLPKAHLKKGQHNEADAICLALYARHYYRGMRNKST